MNKNQTHGDHIGAIMEPRELFANHLNNLIQTGIILHRFNTRALSDTASGDVTEVIALAQDVDDVTWIVLLVKGKKNFEFVSVYPKLQPAEKVKAKITEIAEWENMIEATIFCEVDYDDDEMDGRELQFFATDYAWNKDKYSVGKYIYIDLAAIAYSAKKGRKGFSFKGQEAIDFLAKTGQKPDYDENGNVKPIHFSLENLVAFLTCNEDYPDDVEYQSPINNITKVNTLGVDLYRSEMLFKHDPDRKLALYFKPEFIPNPTEGMPVMGVLWLQGCISENQED